MEQMHFIYVNADGIYGAHSIYKVSMSHEHFQGICCNSNAIRTFRQDRVLEHCVSRQEALDNLPKHIRRKSDSIFASQDSKKKIGKISPRLQ